MQDAIHHFVIETRFLKEEFDFQRIIHFHRPNFGQKGFFRQVQLLNSFFYGSDRSKANVTEERQFTCHHMSEYKMYKAEDWHFSEQLTVGDIYSFFEEIGFDPKTKKYKNGQRVLKFNHEKGRFE